MPEPLLALDRLRVEYPGGVAAVRDLSLVLYDSGLELLPIPDEFADSPEEHRTSIGFS